MRSSSPWRRRQDTPPPPPPAALADFTLLEEIGRGGFGRVYKARQHSIARVVAVKVLHRERTGDPTVLLRFRAEAEVIARIDHPGIVKVHAVGEADGASFLVLEYCPGGTLASRLAGAPLQPRVAAGLLRQLAGAIHAAHEQGVVHRDLKPSNVLFMAGPQTPADEAGPRIVDFGLARLMGDGAGLTGSGDFLGTPAYAAPEQAGGGHASVGPAADVHALGAILYEALVGRPPYKGPTPLETLLLVRHNEPVPPGRIQPNVPRDLEAICLKCLEKEPQRRYHSALELADDLGRFLAGEAVRARPLGWPGRLLRWCRRRPVPAALAGALALTVVLSFAALLLLWRHAERQRALAKHEFQHAHRVIGELVHIGNNSNWDADQHHRFLDAARSYYQEFLRDHAHDPSLAPEVAASCVALSFILVRGNPPGEEPQQMFHEAVAHCERLLRDAPHDASLRKAAAQVWLNFFHWEFHKSKVDRALQALSRAEELNDLLVRGDPQSAQHRERQVQMAGNKAALLLGGKTPGDSLPACQEYLEAAVALTRDYPHALDFMCLLAIASCSVGQAHFHREELTQANIAFAKSLGLCEWLSGQEFTHDRVISSQWRTSRKEELQGRFTLQLADFRGRCHYGLGQIHARRDETDLAEDAYRRAAECYLTALEKTCGEADKRRRPLRARLAAAHHVLGNVLVDSSRPAEAVAAYRKALALRRTLRDQWPEYVVYRCDLKGACERMAQALERMGQREKALVAYLQAIGHQAAAVAIEPDERKHWDALVELSGEVGRKLGSGGPG